ncbi:PREDICTED: suppressor APC domain-containing protein 2 [Gekko japonicus]|uniref:Suppressor APC domain-containing protein 2 n=1 Tax=Gekko japonicus TaxID=146911 RepID=A0ABM1L7P3_GEKJA|nr:PREDICTED: suppressor APC domain-containing protein 2 [Gekko japonicus]
MREKRMQIGLTSQREVPFILWNVRKTFGVGILCNNIRNFPQETRESCAVLASMAPERGGDGRSLLPEEPPCSTEGLPKAFLQSLRTLFDILDDRRRGYVHLREIESRWLQQGTEARELPRGVLEGLRRAAPASGYLTFERFVLGLRASLLTSDKNPSPAIGCNSKGPGLREEGKAPVAENGLGRGGGASRSLEKIPHSRVEPIQCKREAGDIGRKPSQNESASKGLGEARRQQQQRGRCGHRRHTLTNGVDYGMLQQMKELEKEKDFLLQGLEMVEQAREWYHQEIHVLQGRQKQLGKSKVHSGLLAEGSPAKPPNACPAAVNSPECAAASSPPLAGPQQTINMLKEQNRLLTMEVTDKSKRITQLEQEKSALIKQLFEARAQNNRETNQLDSTFI